MHLIAQSLQNLKLTRHEDGPFHAVWHHGQSASLLCRVGESASLRWSRLKLFWLSAGAHRRSLCRCSLVFKGRTYRATACIASLPFHTLALTQVRARSHTRANHFSPHRSHGSLSTRQWHLARTRYRPKRPWGECSQRSNLQMYHDYYYYY